MCVFRFRFFVQSCFFPKRDWAIWDLETIYAITVVVEKVVNSKVGETDDDDASSSSLKQFLFKMKV